MVDRSRTSIEPIKPPSEYDLLGVQDRPDYVRDPYSNAIFNVNDKEIEEYLEKKRLREAQKANQERLDNLESDLNEIKSLLKELINK